ncbi:MAG: DUF444 family protein [Bacillota bacterium]
MSQVGVGNGKGSLPRHLLQLLKHTSPPTLQLPPNQGRHRYRTMNRPCRGDGKTEESIITSDGKRLVKVPIRTLEEYRFRFDPNQGRRVGQGDGDSQVGDVIARGKGQGGSGAGSQPGGEPGIDYYEAEVTVDDLAELIFQDLGLPDLKPKSTQEVPAETVRFTEVRKKGPMSNLDMRRTIMENLKRNARQGIPHLGRISNDDLRFKVWEQELRPSSSAVVLAMRDASGSMGEFKKYITRSLFFWMKGRGARERLFFRQISRLAGIQC